MESSVYQSIKLEILEVLELSKDAIHIHIGLFVFICSWLFWQKGKFTFKLMVPVVALALIMEAFDLHDDWRALGYLRWSSSFHDVLNTTIWPLVFTLIGIRCGHRNDHL